MPWQTNGLRDGFPISFSAVKLSPFPLLELEATRIFFLGFHVVCWKRKYFLLRVIKKKRGSFLKNFVWLFKRMSFLRFP